METNRTLVITGGGRGIGADITQYYLENGYTVFNGSRTDSGGFEKYGERYRYLKTNVKDISELHQLTALAASETGRLDVMINNAGFSEWKPLQLVDETFWTDMIDTNLKGTMFGCQAAAKHMQENGCIINISSLAGKRGTANNSVYCASKFGVNGITQALAKELGHSGIRVNAVCPVFVKTEGVLDALEKEYSPAYGQDVHEFLAQFKKSQSALNRLPLGIEVARTCLFLSSEKSSAVTGQCINVDCGVLPQ